MNPKETYLIVEGSGAFPYDMLRYDQCWPYYGEDSARISAHAHERRRVVLMSTTLARPTHARWQSFGWHVVDFFQFTPPADIRMIPEAA